MFDPIAVKAASYYPLPTRPGIVNNWYAEGVTTSTDWQLETKLDYNLSEKNRLSGRYSPRRSLAVRPNLFGEGKPGLPWEIKHMKSTANNGMMDFTRTHSPWTVISVRLGAVRPEGYHRPLVLFDLTSLGLPKYMKDVADYQVFPQFQPEGYTAIGDAGYTFIGNRNGSWQVLPSLTRFSGAHALRIGGEYRRNYLDYNQSAFPGGSFSFSRQITREDLVLGSDVQGSGLAAMLIGWGSGSRFDHRPWTYNRNEYYAGYVQDDWKIRRRLTLNFGLRYEIERPHWETQYRESYWNLDDPSPLQGKVSGFDLRGFFMFCDEKTPSPDVSHRS
jgi:outer membrane receptor protein involved in Fe transport